MKFFDAVLQLVGMSRQTVDPPLTLVNIEHPDRPRVFVVVSAGEIACLLDDAVVRRGEYRLIDSRGRRTCVYLHKHRVRWGHWWSAPDYVRERDRYLELRSDEGVDGGEYKAPVATEIPELPIFVICTEALDPFYGLAAREEDIAVIIEDSRDIEGGEFLLFDSVGRSAGFIVRHPTAPPEAAEWSAPVHADELAGYLGRILRGPCHEAQADALASLVEETVSAANPNRPSIVAQSDLARAKKRP